MTDPRVAPRQQPLATVLERLRQAAKRGAIGPRAVQKAFGLRSEFLAGRLLQALDVEGRGFADADTFVAAAQAVMEGDASAKLEFLFRLHDEDGDGLIDRDELERLVHIAAAEHELRVGDARLDAMVDAILSAGDQDGNGRIGLVELIAMMQEHPEISERLAQHGVSLLMPGRRAREQLRNDDGGRFEGWLRNELLWAAWLCALGVIHVLLFGEACLRYREAGASVYVQIARGAGACLNFDCALIVLPMLRRALTRLRRSTWGALVPVDDAVRFHALVGEAIVLLSVVHTAAHLANLASTGAPFATLANQTGVVLLAVLAVMWACSRDAVRRSQRFELFHRTHLLYFVFVGVLLVHGPVFYLWAAAPWLGYAIERLLRARRRGMPCRVLVADRLLSGVTRVVLERPLAFFYAPGDYVFLRIPALARHEWHPFTLTSAPEDPERLSVHVRRAGNWTTALRQRAPRLAREGELLAYLDGPYGTASRHLLETPHAIAIAGGIGVTPFASVLQSLLLQAQDPHGEPPALKKLHFVWLAREQLAFEWFRELLASIEKRDVGKVLDLHIFMTSGRADMAGGLLDLGQRLLQRRGLRDLVTGLRTPTNMGGPDLDRLLESFCQHDARESTPPRPEVFFCGPASLERAVKRTCRRLGLRMRAERF